jgi:glycosyltransferase involved in cell wall biosynthesis
VEEGQNPVRIVAIIPTYNNALTIKTVVQDTLKYVDNVIVVNDGSTDTTRTILAELAQENPSVLPVNFKSNKGKGCALRAGFDKAMECGFTNAITLDGDGQHYTSDIPLFIEKVTENGNKLYIGDRILDGQGVPQPLRSRAGAKIGAFWYKFSTGLVINDTQCGFRAYPVAEVARLKAKGDRYEYEQELLIKAAWNGINVEPVAIHIHYEPKETAVSHFRPVRDFLRISKVNSKAAIIKILLPFLIVDMPGASWKDKIIALFKHELHANFTPKRATFSLTLGVFIAILPIYFFQVLLLLALSFIIRINRPLAFLGVSVSSAPLLPFIIAAAVAIGKLVVPIQWGTLFSHSKYHSIISGGMDWFFGSIILACICAIICWAISYPVFLRLAKRNAEKKA